MRELTHLSLFSGIGGLDLASEMAGFVTVGQCEWADYPTKVLEKHWPDVPRWRNIRTLTKESFYERTGLRTVDIISGGFPCQPFSLTGKRNGKEDDRYLWPEMLRVVEEIRPSWVLGENVPGIINLALDTVLSDLETIGYATQAVIVPACGADAPHRRYRCAILAHAESIRCCYGDDGKDKGKTDNKINALTDTGLLRGTRPFTDTKSKCDTWRLFRCAENTGQVDGERLPDGGRAEEPLRRERRQNESRIFGMADWLRTEIHGTDTNAESIGLQRRSCKPLLFTNCSSRERERESGNKIPAQSVRTGRSHSAWENWPDESGLDRVVDGVPNRVDRLKCLGNAVVPQQFFPFFYYIAKIEKGETMIPDDPIIASIERTGYPPWMQEEEGEEDD